jgi:hypothetical protein
VPRKKWYDFYSDALDPVMSAGSEIDIRLELEVCVEQELGGDPVEHLRDSLRKYGKDAKLDAG